MSNFENKLSPMIILLALLLVIEVMTLLVLTDFFQKRSRMGYFICLFINVVLICWLWPVFIRTTTFRGEFDTPENIWLHMKLAGLICAIVIPKFILTIFHFSGRLFRMRRGGYSRVMTLTGILTGLLVFIVVGTGLVKGRFNFKAEEVTVKIKGLDPRLEGFKIIHISDLHLSSFFKHPGQMAHVIEIINGYQADIIINTGDFINSGWREFGRFDTILAKSESRYGKFAVLGNHDMGTYFPGATDDVKAAIVRKMKEQVTESGYRLLDNEHLNMNIRGVNIVFTGVETSGRFPRMIHTDPSPLMAGTDSAALRILLIHDPNQWRKDIVGKTNAELSLAGHTHGMQIGILTKRLRWSPSKYFYPEWNGLFSEGNQFLYVNRGLGTLSVAFRIWMPPEITLLTLSAG